MCTPAYVCDRGFRPRAELHLYEGASVLVLVDELGTRCEVELLRSWALILFVLARAYVEDQTTKPRKFWGLRRSSAVGRLYGDQPSTFAAISEAAVVMYVYKIRLAVKRAVSGCEQEMGRPFVHPLVIETVDGSYRIGERGLEVYTDSEIG